MESGLFLTVVAVVGVTVAIAVAVVIYSECS